MTGAALVASCIDCGGIKAIETEPQDDNKLVQSWIDPGDIVGVEDLSVVERPEWEMRVREPMTACRVYWGTHGCRLERGHDGPHICDCAVEDEGAFDPETREYIEDRQVINVGAPPYYGPGTAFYGEDATEAERNPERADPAAARSTTKRPGETHSEAMNRLTEGWDL